MNELVFHPLPYRLLLLVAIAAAGFGVQPAGADDPPAVAETEEAALNEAEIAPLIAQLDAPDFRVRREASRRLAAAGAAAVDALMIAAREGSLETKVRAVTVLEEMYTSSDNATFEAAERALESLTLRPDRSLASRADLVLSRHYEVREQRAIAAIQRMGGTVEYADEAEANLRGLNMVEPNALRRPIRFVQLDGGWKGGDAGLKQIARLRPESYFQNQPTLYLIDGTGITPKGLEDLQAAVPQLAVQNRGRALLGVQGSTDVNGRGCLVAMVKAGSSAEKGNIQPGDVIVSFNEKPSPNFETLIELIGDTRPGDKVKVEVLRGFQTVSLEVEMSGWRQK